jgi:predicted ATP-grasp superfamily ATP-dependent carboligase
VTTRTILVSDGEQRSALAAVRSFGRAGHTVHVLSRRGRSLAGASRRCTADWSTPDPLSAPDAYAQRAAEIIRAQRIDTLIPIAESSLLATAPLRTQMPNVLYPFAELEAFQRISDKAALLDAAPRYGIAIPSQHVLHAAADMSKLSPDELRFPIVLKPSRSVGEAGGERKKLGVRHAANRAELEREVASMDPAGYPLLLQQRVMGPGVGIFLLLWDGRIIAEFSHRRIREKPPSGGVSVYRESIPADPDLVRRSKQLLDHFEWRGVAMVEYKVDQATGTPYLMEINGRFWGSLQLAIDAGVDFPTLLLDAAEGRAPAKVPQYRSGVRSRWEWGDVDHLIARLRRTNAELALPDDAPSRWRAVRDFLTLWRAGDRNEVLRASDPAPFFRETIEWFQGR